MYAAVAGTIISSVFCDLYPLNSSLQLVNVLVAALISRFDSTTATIAFNVVNAASDLS